MCVFFFNDPRTTEIYAYGPTLSLHDALPISIVAGVGEFAAGEFAPLNRIGDLEGAVLENGVVRLPRGYAEAYRAYVEQGWNAIASPVEHGGQGLPFTLACNVLENLGTANLAFNLLPMLSVGAIEALEHHAQSDERRGGQG